MTVRLALDPVSLTVEAGSKVTCTATVRNTSSIVERFTILVLGAPSAWTDVDPAAISLLPDAERTVAVNFRPPRGPVPNAATLAFAVKVIPTKQAEDTVVEEGDITVNPFVELVPSLRPRTSRGATAGRHVVRLSNRGNSPVDASLTSSDPDELLKSKIDPARVRVLPGTTAAARVVMRPRQVRFLGPPQPRPFQVHVEATGRPPMVIDGSYLQRPMLPRWLPRLAAGLLVAVVATALYAGKAARVTNVAKVAADTTVPTTAKPTPPTTPPGGATTAPPGGTAELGYEPGVQGLSCDPYDPTNIPSPSPAQPPVGATTITTAAPAYNVTTTNPNVSFQFANLTDAKVAYAILTLYKQVCYIGRPAPKAEQMMVLEPYQNLPKFPNFPQIPGAHEHCTPYDNAPGTLVPMPGDGYALLVDLSAGPVPPLQKVDNNTDAQTALLVARAHKQRCWVGGGQNWSSLDTSSGLVLEYWR